jgi:hypothetical protein
VWFEEVDIAWAFELGVGDPSRAASEDFSPDSWRIVGRLIQAGPERLYSHAAGDYKSFIFSLRFLCF